MANATYTTSFKIDTTIEARRLAAMLNLAEAALDLESIRLGHYGCLNDRPCAECDFVEAQEIADKL